MSEDCVPGAINIRGLGGGQQTGLVGRESPGGLLPRPQGQLSGEAPLLCQRQSAGGGRYHLHFNLFSQTSISSLSDLKQLSLKLKIHRTYGA